MRFCFPAGYALALVSCLVACTTSVRQPDDGEGGDSNEGGAPGNGPGAGPGAGSGAAGGSSVAAAQAAACNDICATWGTCYPSDDCVGECVAEEVPYCFEEWLGSIECAVDTFNGNCLQQSYCEEQSDAYLACQDANTCESYGCGQDATTCTCNGLCKNVDLDQVCQFTDGGVNIPCDCYADGAFLGSCTTNGDACNIASGCCMDLL